MKRDRNDAILPVACPIPGGKCSGTDTSGDGPCICCLVSFRLVKSRGWGRDSRLGVVRVTVPQTPRCQESRDSKTGSGTSAWHWCVTLQRCQPSLRIALPRSWMPRDRHVIWHLCVTSAGTPGLLGRVRSPVGFKMQKIK